MRELRVIIYVADREMAGTEIWIVHDTAMPWRAGIDAVQHELIQGARHARHRSATIGSMHDQLGEEGVVVQTNLEALNDSTVPSYARALGNLEPAHAARGRQEAVRGILRGDPAFDGVPGQGDLVSA